MRMLISVLGVVTQQQVEYTEYINPLNHLLKGFLHDVAETGRNASRTDNCQQQLMSLLPIMHLLSRLWGGGVTSVSNFSDLMF